MKILMHICCSNCLIYPYKTLTLRGIEIAGLWFNPNIHPYIEYQSRLLSLKQLEQLWNLKIQYHDYYGLKSFLAEVAQQPENRCHYCYHIRLQTTAISAKEMGFQAFTTSLLVSPYQKTGLIKKIGNTLAEQYNIEFISEDFTDGFYVAKREAKSLGLYSQKYCGCVYSEMERYVKN